MIRKTEEEREREGEKEAEALSSLNRETQES